MNESQRDCSMPFAVRRKRSFLYFLFHAVLFAALGVWVGWKLQSDPYLSAHNLLLMVIYVGVTAVLLAPMLARCLMQLHFAPEGISVKLFGLMLRHFPAERIKLISGLQCSYQSGAAELQTAVCDYSVEELTRLGGEKLFPYGDPPWEGAYAKKYLDKYGSSFIFREYNLHKNILWFDWSPDRLRILQRMYPDVQWLDCSEKKIFDKQINS